MIHNRLALLSVLLFVFISTPSPAFAADSTAPGPLSITDAQIAMGVPRTSAEKSGALGTGRGFKFAIIDAGFNGLGAWLEQHPQVKARATRVSLRKGGAESGDSHGFRVFLVAHQIMPEADFLFIETGSHIAGFKDILETMYDNQCFLGTMSLGWNLYLGGADVSRIDPKLKLLDKYQFTLLKSAGNSRTLTHTFPYLDRDGDGVLEFSLRREGNPQTVGEDVPVGARKGKAVYLVLSWTEWGNVQSSFELQLLDKDDRLVASKVNKSGIKSAIEMRIEPEQDGIHWVKLLDRSEQPVANKPEFSLTVLGAATSAKLFNGRESLNAYSQHESPFLISVGSFGRDDSGRLAPSRFSSAGHTDSGEVAPQVLGPGQLLLNGREESGTSFSTPFIAALYGSHADYNIKNFIQASTTHDRWVPGLSPEERGRWGVPDYARIQNNECTASNRLDNLRHRFEADKLVVEFDFTRHCMQGLDYYLHGYMHRDGDDGGIRARETLLKSPDGKNDLRAWRKKHSAARNVEREPIRLEYPLNYIPKDQFGKTVELRFALSTRAQWTPVPIPNAPRYRVALPADGLATR